MCEGKIKEVDIHNQKTIVPSLWDEVGNDTEQPIDDIKNNTEQEAEEVLVIAEMPTEKIEGFRASEPTVKETRHCFPSTKISELSKAQHQKTANVNLTAEEARELSEFINGSKE